MTLLLIGATALAAFAAGWIACHREHRHPDTSAWWAGWQVGRGHGYHAGRLSRTEGDSAES